MERQRHGAGVSGGIQPLLWKDKVRGKRKQKSLVSYVGEGTRVGNSDNCGAGPLI